MPQSVQCLIPLINADRFSQIRVGSQPVGIASVMLTVRRTHDHYRYVTIRRSGLLKLGEQPYPVGSVGQVPILRTAVAARLAAAVFVAVLCNSLSK